eukprot:1155769-Pelagomonas_calceolata.AAC.3
MAPAVLFMRPGAKLASQIKQMKMPPVVMKHGAIRGEHKRAVPSEMGTSAMPSKMGISVMPSKMEISSMPSEMGISTMPSKMEEVAGQPRCHNGTMKGANFNTW